MEKVFTREWLGRPLIIKTGKVALQANAAVWVQYGETVVQATVVQAKSEREGVSFFPLMVDIEEKLYAAGIIKGSRWIKREGRPSDQAVLTGRMIDRAIRPLFDQKDKRDIQVILSVLAIDEENNHDIVALIAASAALAISGADWKGPISGIRVGLIAEKFIFNPTYEEQEKSSLDLVIAGTSKKTIMIEAGANNVPDETIHQAMIAGQEKMQGALELIKELQENVAPKESSVETKKLQTSEEKEAEKEKIELLKLGKDWLNDNIKKILFAQIYYTKGERKAALYAIKNQLEEYLISKDLDSNKRHFVLNELVEEMVEEEVTRAILEEKHRVDGRALDEIRTLLAEVKILPRDHGTALFSRGETKVMSVVTLGAPGMEQTIDGLNGESKKRYMHHYNFPPYSVGEAKPLRGTGRREI